ncbi:MAG: hypothetical protein KZQ94_22215 [Candidatus Thiodiazotropha sp. (ex Troendleina suluensis)]|nr:hypothetical protein [Candidatus Thiodiazotropha sp. (ex Troendleina suluensis)]
MDLLSKPIRVAVIGMDERLKNALSLFFEGSCNNIGVLVDEDTAEAGIIDVDAYRGRENLTHYKERHPDQSIILISINDVSLDDEVSLKKPLKQKQLISALIQAKKRIISQDDMPELFTKHKQSKRVSEGVKPRLRKEIPEKSVEISNGELSKSTPSNTHHAAMLLNEKSAKMLIGTAPDIDPADPLHIVRIQFDPSNYFHSHLYKSCITADRKNRYVQLTTTRGSICIFPDGRNMTSNLSNSQLRTLSAVPVVSDTVSVSLMNTDYKHEENEDYFTTNRDSLLWKTALWASRGRVPVGTSLETPVMLNQWPNMTRLLLFPHALRIAAMWINQPYSLLTTAETLGIPQRYVFGFYSAAHAVGLVSTSKQNNTINVAAEKQQNSNKHSLFRRILNRLRK